MGDEDFTRRPLAEGLECTGSPPRGIPPVAGPSYHGQPYDPRTDGSFAAWVTREQRARWQPVPGVYRVDQGRNPVDDLEPIVRDVAARTGYEVDEEALSAARAHCDELVPLPVRDLWTFDQGIASPLMALLESFCLHVTQTRPANQNIGRNENAYIDRWMLARKGVVPTYDDPVALWGAAGFIPSELENLYLHAYHRGDADEPHDHPWGNASLVVRGWYREAVFIDGKLAGHFTRHRGDVVLRSATAVHAIIDTSGDCLSLFATLPKERDWGFHTADGFVPWQQFGKSNGERRP